MKKGFIQNMDNTVVEKHICTACMACKNVCPIDAIEIKEDDEHFIYPYVDKTKCTNCGLCKKVCPALKVRQTQTLRECNSKKPVAYGGYIDDEHIRENSSSGGVFTILSKYIFDKKGYVCGASHIQGAKVEHIIINSENDLDKIRGSKYVQSNINNCYKSIKQLLEKTNMTVISDEIKYYICGISLFKRKNFDSGNKIKYYIFGIPLLKKQIVDDGNIIKYCFCNIPFYVKKIQNSGKKIKYYIFGLPLFKIKSR